MLGTVNGTTTLYLGDYVEYLPGDQPTLKKYYYAGGARVAEWDGTKLWYLLQDHLGSTTIAQPAGGSANSEQRYTAAGSVRFTSGTIPTTITYTGQRAEAAIGLMFYNARWFDSALGRFIQADTVIPNPGNPVAFDRYAYCFNNPVNTVDPTGHMPTGYENTPRATSVYLYLNVAQDSLLHHNDGNAPQIIKYHKQLRAGLCGEISLAMILEDITGLDEQLPYVLDNSDITDTVVEGKPVYDTGGRTGGGLCDIFEKIFPGGWEATWFYATSATTYLPGYSSSVRVDSYPGNWYGPEGYEAAVKNLIKQGTYVIAGVWCDPGSGKLESPHTPGAVFHWVLVDGYDENDDTITINNPFYDTQETYPWSVFKESAQMIDPENKKWVPADIVVIKEKPLPQGVLRSA